MTPLLLIAAAALLFMSGGKTPKTGEPPKDTAPLHTVVAMGSDELWTFVAIENGKVVYSDPGPYASQQAAQTAADNWMAKQGGGVAPS